MMSEPKKVPLTDAERDAMQPRLIAPLPSGCVSLAELGIWVVILPLLFAGLVTNLAQRWLAQNIGCGVGVGIFVLAALINWRHVARKRHATESAHAEWSAKVDAMDTALVYDLDVVKACIIDKAHDIYLLEAASGLRVVVSGAHCNDSFPQRHVVLKGLEEPPLVIALEADGGAIDADACADTDGLQLEWLEGYRIL